MASPAIVKGVPISFLPYVIALACLVSACTGAAPSHTIRSASPSPPGPSTKAASDGETSTQEVPENYQRACTLEGGVCPPKVNGVIPAVLLNRPLRFPSITKNEACPTTHGKNITTPYFGGVALGDGPVRPILAEEPVTEAQRGIADLLTRTSAPGWMAFKTLWFSERGYQGPFIIRARRIDGNTPIAMGEGPTTAMLVVPPGPTINGGSGWRTAPGGTWVKEPGCYAWQVDGDSFTEVLVVQAIVPHP